MFGRLINQEIAFVARFIYDLYAILTPSYTYTTLVTILSQLQTRPATCCTYERVNLLIFREFCLLYASVSFLYRSTCCSYCRDRCSFVKPTLYKYAVCCYTYCSENYCSRYVVAFSYCRCFFLLSSTCITSVDSEYKCEHILSRLSLSHRML